MGVHPADIQDRDGGVLVMSTPFGLYPFLKKLYADGGSQGPNFRDGPRRVCRSVDVEIGKRSDQAKGFTVLPGAGSSNAALPGINRCRRLAKDFECPSRSALAFRRWAAIRVTPRRLCQDSI